MMARRTDVPALVAADVIDTLCHWHDLIGAAMTSEAGRRILQEDIYKRLQAGTLPTASVIAAAEAGHQDADLTWNFRSSTIGEPLRVSHRARFLSPWVHRINT